MASFRDSYGDCRAWLNHMSAESLLAVELSDAEDQQRGHCALAAAEAMDSACAEDGIWVRTEYPF